MHKPPRRMHASTGRSLFAHRYPRGHRANSGIFSIPEPAGAGTGARNRAEDPDSKPAVPQRPPIFCRMRPMTTPFRPKSSMQVPPSAEYSQKCTPHATPGKRQPDYRARSLLQPSNLLARNAEYLTEADRPISRCIPQDERTSAARSAQRRFFHVRGRAGREGRPRAGQVGQLTRRCKPSCAYPQQHQTGCPSGSRGASSSQGRSRCSQPGRSRSRRHRRPCCRSRPPGR